MIYRGLKNKSYQLANTPFSQGGEGAIYNIVGESSKVAKIYKSGKADKIKENKLKAMIAHPLSDDALSQFAWPLDGLYSDSGEFVGFVMPKLSNNEDLNVIYQYPPDPKYANISWSNKITIAMNLCTVLQAVHDAGHVVGDFNPKNISVDPSNGLITFFDTDSFHIIDDRSVYRCDVGMSEYLAPELQIKLKSEKGNIKTASLPTFTSATDRFALAIHIFQLLMNGCHPFACRAIPSQQSVVLPQPTDNIINGVFPFMNASSGTDIPIYAPPMSILSVEMQRLFKRAFVSGYSNPEDRPYPVEWYAALRDMQNGLVPCSADSIHEYYKAQKHCPWCALENKIANGQYVKPRPTMQQPIATPPMPPSTSTVQTTTRHVAGTGRRLGVGLKLLYSILAPVSAFLGLLFENIIELIIELSIESAGTDVSLGRIESGFLGFLLFIACIGMVLFYIIKTIVGIWRNRYGSKSILLKLLATFIISAIVFFVINVCI